MINIEQAPQITLRTFPHRGEKEVLEPTKRGERPEQLMVKRTGGTQRNKIGGILFLHTQQSILTIVNNSGGFREAGTETRMLQSGSVSALEGKTRILKNKQLSASIE